MHEWIKLTGRWGVEKQSPTDSELKEALNELFGSDEDNEHPDAWLECGSENGSLYTASIFASGYAIFTKYSDADMTTELKKTEIGNINHETGLRLWKNLINENYDEIS
ncbi:MAG: hypothetical protein V4495_24565 [Pseudomonadota bacterium]